MATRVRLTADVDPEVKKQVRIAAIQSETSVSEWVERAVIRELERANDIAVEEEEELILPPAGVKPRGLRDRIRLRGGGTMSDAVIEDRR